MHPNDKLLIDFIKNTTREKIVDKRGKKGYIAGNEKEGIMENVPDIIKDLKEKKAYHAEQLRLINRALVALRVEVKSNNKPSINNARKPRRTPWTNELIKTFKEYPSEQFTAADLRDLLREKGLPVDETGNKNAVYTTLTRLVRNGKITKSDDGVYQYKNRIKRVRKDRPSIIDDPLAE